MADRRCQGTSSELKLAVGVMSRPIHADQRSAVRHAWGRADRSVLACFVIGRRSKRTPVNPWAVAWKKAMDAKHAIPPSGQLSVLPMLPMLMEERNTHGDVLLLNESAEIDSGGTSGLKTLPWWRHAAFMLPAAQWVGKADDDTLLNLPNLLPRLPALPSPVALFGTINWACYSARRYKHERSSPRVSCGRTKFAQSQHPGEPSGLARTYEGPYQFAFGWFYAMPRALVVRLAECDYARQFHHSALHATAEPFFRKEDDPMNGHWLHKCLNATGERVQPLPSLGPRVASNMACMSNTGLYRRPHNKSVIIHFLKSSSAMNYAVSVLHRLRSGVGLLPSEQQCCTANVWPRRSARSAAARAQRAEVCDNVTTSSLQM